MRPLLITALLLSGACAQESGPPAGPADVHAGQRILIGCPATEQCSEATPWGLRVRSLTYLGEPPFYTVTGGSQRFELLWPDGTPFDLPFTAEAVGPEIGVAGYEQSPATLTITGDAVGGNLVALRDPDSGELYDQVWFIDKPVGAAFLPPLRGANSLISGRLFVPNDVEVTVELHSTDSEYGAFSFGEREYVADEGLRVTADAGLQEIGALEPLGGQRFRLRAANPGDGVLRIETAGTSFDIPIGTVDTVEEIGPPEDSVELVVGETDVHCAYAMTDGWFVVGADMVYSATGAVEIVEADLCAEVLLHEAGAAATLTATAGGTSRTWSVVAAP